MEIELCFCAWLKLTHVNKEQHAETNILPVLKVILSSNCNSQFVAVSEQKEEYLDNVKVDKKNVKSCRKLKWGQTDRQTAKERQIMTDPEIKPKRTKIITTKTVFKTIAAWVTSR